MRPDRTSHKADRNLLLGLVDALSVSKTRLSRDLCGDWNIVGRRGHIATDGTAIYVYMDCKTKRRWEAAKFALGLPATQDGDTEGVMRLDDLPSESLAETIRRLLGLRKSVRPSDRQRAILSRFHFRRDSTPVSGGFISTADAAATHPAPTTPSA
ncbi:hypothetical protein V1290_007371 [Bradyrhizobium sp. AZCC 1578]|uniref:hypothetical protein n=1 Tax=Bradyrhizobium sp. AZCC 1578 TaxID=3117027 RepID=UPI002FF2B509